MILFCNSIELDFLFLNFETIKLISGSNKAPRREQRGIEREEINCKYLRRFNMKVFQPRPASVEFHLVLQLNELYDYQADLMLPSNIERLL